METKKQNSALRVLYLEDSKLDVELLRTILEEAYLLDFTSVDDRQAFEEVLLSKKSLDIILSDYNLPDIDAPTALAIAQKHCPDIPFICISGTIGEEKAVDLLKQGAVDYILKDRMARLTSSIDRALNEAEEKRILAEAQEALKQQNKELRIAKQKAEESDHLKSVFLSNMSHEVRTPMNGIVGFSELLIRSDDPIKQAKYVRTIQNSCEQLMHIINSIVDISLIEANQVFVNKTEVELEHIFNYVNSILQEDFERKRIHLKQLEIPENCCELTTDASKLTQILTNLISNGLKFTSQGFVEYGVRRQNGTLHFHVRDTGIGIPEEKHPVIFERFRQVEEGNTRKYGGSGLGLSIAKSFVEALDGQIWLQSKPGEGSTFFFSIPV
ncbi:ATP-binding response regulator [Sunxiuqinia elliptica]|uniref:histidine kinase n=1 Tax=Sunxiuqinia elliptica TaxID=655355 RepID=A0A1I2EUL2_9BACT|nr:ATP-binding protein [Sunxiuqinia elliptica]SFE96535.1 Signal transduction histidine kinase [Sunxiuqinia elliptica]